MALVPGSRASVADLQSCPLCLARTLPLPCAHLLSDFLPVPESWFPISPAIRNGGFFIPVLSPTQSKRKFERDCREAEKAAQTAERLDQDINATKADVEKVPVGWDRCGGQGGMGPEPASDIHLHIPQAKQQAHIRSHMAEESKNEYAAQLQRFNRDQAHFYFSQMPQIFDVSALAPSPTFPTAPPTVLIISYMFVEALAALS